MPSAEEDAREVDAEQAVPLGHRLLGARSGADDAGVGDEAAQPATGLDRLLADPREQLLVTDVASDADVWGAELGKGRGERVGVAVDPDDDMAGRGKALCDRLAHAAGGAGDDDPPAGVLVGGHASAPSAAAVEPTLT